jgi:hypothetical protein
MKTTVTREYRWIESEAADAFIANGESLGTDLEILQAVARLADDTDEAEAILAFVNDLHRDDPPVR